MSIVVTLVLMAVAASFVLYICVSPALIGLSTIASILFESFIYSLGSISEATQFELELRERRLRRMSRSIGVLCWPGAALYEFCGWVYSLIRANTSSLRLV